MMIAQWVLNSFTVDSRRRIMKEFLKFNIDGTNYDGPMIIHHILSTAKPMIRSGISNVNINLGKMKMKDFDNNLSLENEQVKG